MRYKNAKGITKRIKANFKNRDIKGYKNVSEYELSIHKVIKPAKKINKDIKKNYNADKIFKNTRNFFRSEKDRALGDLRNLQARKAKRHK